MDCHRELRAALCALALHLHAAGAQEPEPIDRVVVTATRSPDRSFDVPAAVDAIDVATIRDGRPMINISETLNRVPGVVARNRQNYAQDLQVSSRGFGARATFGVRGIRLYQDDIPQTMPDGQGQTGSFQLLSASRIEVLRGPFAALYGNASGGVIAVFTDPGSPEPEAAVNTGGGSDDAFTLGVKTSGTRGGVRYVAAASRFSTDGYRDHSAAVRDLAVARVEFPVAEVTRVTLLGTSQSQPDSLDPLGLTRAQWEADPRNVDPAALQFDTRKTVRQLQGGARVEHTLGPAATLVATGYAGRRDVRQYLAFAGAAPASSGGVTDLGRQYGGAALRVAARIDVLGRPVRVTVGASGDLQDERRRGFVNDNGALGALRRDEDDTVRSTDVFAQAEFDVHPRVGATLGVRASRVRFRAVDHYVTAGNPDDSGNASYGDTTPVAGLVFRLGDAVNAYATFGQGFETPTFAELAYRPGGPGLNFDLRAATSRAREAGLKAMVAPGHRVDAALFAVDTDDEIVVALASGGRTTYRNAGRTKRRGAEVAWDGGYSGGLTSRLALAWLDATFVDDVPAGPPGASVRAGNRLPGAPDRTAYFELAWSPPPLPWLALGVEVEHAGSVAVDDRNSDFAPAYTVAALRARGAWSAGAWTLSAFARLDNLFDRRYAGSVIVGDANGRYFEPAPGRTWFLGAGASVRL